MTAVSDQSDTSRNLQQQATSSSSQHSDDESMGTLASRSGSDDKEAPLLSNNNNNENSIYFDDESEHPPPKTKLLHTHHFSDAELKKMGAYSSVDTWEPVTELLLERNDDDEERERGDEKKKKKKSSSGGDDDDDDNNSSGGGSSRVAYLAWLLYMIVGFCIGFWAILVFHSIDQLHDVKMKFIAGLIHDSKESEAFILHVVWSFVAMFLSTGIVALYPNAGGSGMPEVISQLNGIAMPELVKAKVVLFKSFSVIMSVHSGIPVGAEGPMIHFGSIIGGLVTAGRTGSKTLNRWLRPLYRTFQNPKDQRDFVTAGAAAGVTSVFASPVGGFLFVMEELASHMSPAVAERMFTACLCCYLFVQVGGTYLDGWQAAKLPTTEATDGWEHIFSMNPFAVTLFNQNVNFKQYVAASVPSLLPAAAVAIGLGLFAAMFIHIHKLVVGKWRWPFVNKNTWFKCAEPLVMSVLFACLFFHFSLVMPCMEIPPGFSDEQLINGDDGDYASSSSSSNNNQTTTTTTTTMAPSSFFSSLSSSLLFSSSPPSRNGGGMMMMMMSSSNRHTSPLFPSSSTSATLFGRTITPEGNSSANDKAFFGGLRLYTAVCKENVKGQRPTHYSGFATLALTGAYNTIRIGMARKCMHLIDVGSLALFFVIYALGAAYCIGMFIASGIVIPTLVIGSIGGRLIGCRVIAPFGDPGVMALMGAASFFTGLSRLTISLVVIMVECSDDLAAVTVMMFCVTLAKLVADPLSHSLYHEQLGMRGVPYLDFEVQIHNFDKHCAADIMTPDPMCLPLVCTVDLLEKAARHPTFSGFPVVARGLRQDDAECRGHFLRRSEHTQVAKEWKSARGMTMGAENNSSPSPPVPAADSILYSKSAILSDARDFTFVGILTREMAGRLLWHLHICELHSKSKEPPQPHYNELCEIDDYYKEQQPGDNTSGGGKGFWLPPTTSAFTDRLIDLSAYINKSAYYVGSESSVSRVYNLFRQVSLRYLSVVDGANQLVGIIKRKDVLGDFLNKKIKAKEDAIGTGPPNKFKNEVLAHLNN